jgi:hypothetical protein
MDAAEPHIFHFAHNLIPHMTVISPYELKRLTRPSDKWTQFPSYICGAGREEQAPDKR